jgi:hypothetical protein
MRIHSGVNLETRKIKIVIIRNDINTKNILRISTEEKIIDTRSLFSRFNEISLVAE